MGICVRCRTRHCSECITKVDGVNHCAGCLAELAREGRGAVAPAKPRSNAFRRTSAVISVALVSGLAWALLEAVLPGGR